MVVVVGDHAQPTHCSSATIVPPERLQVDQVCKVLPINALETVSPVAREADDLLRAVNVVNLTHQID